MEALGYLVIYGLMFLVAGVCYTISERKNATDTNNK